MLNRRLFMLAVILGVTSAMCLYGASSRLVSTGLGNVLMFLAGLLAMAALSTLYRSLDIMDDLPRTSVVFDEALLADMLEDAAMKSDVKLNDLSTTFDSEDWRPRLSVTAEDLLGQDNSLALAALRMDIEYELRRIAFDANVDLRVGQLGIRRLADQLSITGHIRREALTIISEVLMAIDRAMHGHVISTDTAGSIILIGRRLELLLRRSTVRNKN